MRNLLSFAVLLALAASNLAHADRIPRPFPDAHRDGFTWSYWNDATPELMNAALDRIAATGAKHLLIPYWGCQSDIHSADVGACKVNRATRADPVTLARAAMAKGFTASFLPIVATPDWQWRGFFDPTDVEGWFRTYGDWVKGIAREAQALGLNEFVVSTETTKLYQYEAQWKKLLTELRDEFSGPLILTVNWGDEEHGFWSEADAIGVSAYYPLSTAINPPQAVLDAAWQTHHDKLLALSHQWNRPIRITEVGYTSTTAAASTPWNYTAQDSSDFALQARCFEAFRKAWEKEPTLVRATIWATETGNPIDDTFSMSFEPLGKPAENVIRRFLAARSQ